MSLNIISVSYQDLAASGLISDLKHAATCDVKNVCRLACNRCPNVYFYIELEEVAIKGLQIDYIMIKKSKGCDDFNLHLSAKDIVDWMKKNNITYQKARLQQDELI